MIGRCSWWLDSATLPLPRRGTVLVLKELIQASYRGAVGNNTFLSPTRDVFDGPPRALRRGRRTRMASPDGCVEQHFKEVSTGIGTCAQAPYSRLDPVDQLFKKPTAIDQSFDWRTKENDGCLCACFAIRNRGRHAPALAADFAPALRALRQGIRVDRLGSRPDR